MRKVSETDDDSIFARRMEGRTGAAAVICPAEVVDIIYCGDLMFCKPMTYERTRQCMGND